MTVTHAQHRAGIADLGAPRLNTAQAAAALQVSVRTVRRWADDGTLSSISTLGGHRRFDANDVLRLVLSRHAHQTKAEIAAAVRHAANVVRDGYEPATPVAVPRT